MREILILRTFITVTLLALISSGISGQSKSKDKVIEVPFDLYKNEIIVQVQVDGKGPFNMMLDTGADPSAIDLTLARDLGLNLARVEKRATGGGAGNSLIFETQLPMVETGGLMAKKVEALAIDLSNLGGRLGKHLHGILGHSLLNGRVVQIDYPNRVLRFYSKSPINSYKGSGNSSEMVVLAFRYSDNILIDDIVVNGRKLTANLDTGSDGAFSLTPAAVAYLGLEKDVEGFAVTTSVGVNGTLQNRQGTIGTITLGRLSVASQPAVFFGPGTGRDHEPWGINIGNVFLKDFIVTIDYKAKRVILQQAHRP